MNAFQWAKKTITTHSFQEKRWHTYLKENREPPACFVGEEGVTGESGIPSESGGLSWLQSSSDILLEASSLAIAIAESKVRWSAAEMGLTCCGWSKDYQLFRLYENKM